MIEHEINLQLATINDQDLIFEWRNQPEVRRYFFCSEPITQLEHSKWYENVLADENRVLLIADSQGVKFGVVRFDIADDLATVDVYVNPSVMGQGYGSALLKCSVKWLKQHKKNVKKVRAEILTENKASIKAFTKAGFDMKFVTHEVEI
jgi:UDP-2,4-diacetamido-2,4,6-trideoxy-beta-L-altropyranose hydrolase